MKNLMFRPVVAVAAVLTVAAAGIALQPEGQPDRRQQAGQPGDRPQRGQGGPGGERAISVEGAMKGVNRALRQLNSQIGDETKREENLKLLNDMERGMVNAKGAPLSENLFKDAKDEAARAKIVDHFRADVIKALRLMLDIETDLAAGKTDDAKAKVSELVKLKNEAHAEMGVDD